MNVLRRLREDCEGAAMVEFAIVFPMLLLLIGGIVDFGWAFWEMNMAAKAVERGARIAAVSNPVAAGYEDISTGSDPGEPLPDAFTFNVTCKDGACSGGGGYDPDAMNTIVYGRGNGGACNTAAEGVYAIGMCNLFSKITPANVVVEYAAAPNVGFQGRPCGPVSTITVSLKGITFGGFFLGGAMSLAGVSFPPMRTTITSEDLSFAATNPNC